MCEKRRSITVTNITKEQEKWLIAQAGKTGLSVTAAVKILINTEIEKEEKGK